MSHACRLHVRRGRSESTAATAGTGLWHWRGWEQESCSLSLPVSQLLKACPGPYSLPTHWTRTFIHGMLPYAGLLHCFCGSLPCQDSQDFQGAGLQEAARLGECWGVGTYNSHIISWPCPSVAHRRPALHVLVPAGCARAGRVAPLGEPLAVPPALIPPFPTALGRDGGATAAGVSGSRLLPSDHRGGTPQLVHSLGPVCFYMNNHPVCASQRTKKPLKDLFLSVVCRACFSHHMNLGDGVGRLG